MAGGVVTAARIRIKGRKASVLRFFVISVAYTITWITLSSELGYYGALYGKQVLLQLNIAYYLPSIPVLILSGHVEKIMDRKLGPCLSMFTRLIAGLVGCGFVCAYFPFLPMSLSFLLGMVMLLGVTSAIAFSTSYQLVAWFRSADTIALGLGMVGSGPLVLIIQLCLGMGTNPHRWQWIWMFEIGGAIVVCGIMCAFSLMWQYAAIISGKEPYLEKPLLAGASAAGAEEEEEEEDDGEPPLHIRNMMLSPRMMSLADPFSGFPLPAVTSRTSRRVTGTHMAALDQETGVVRPVRRAASMDSDYSLSMWNAIHAREWLRSKTLNVARSTVPVSHFVSPPPSAKTQIPPGDAEWNDLPGSSNWGGFPSIASNIEAAPTPSAETPTAVGMRARASAAAAVRSASAAAAGPSSLSLPNAFVGGLADDSDDRRSPSPTSPVSTEPSPLPPSRPVPPLPSLSLAVTMARRKLMQGEAPAVAAVGGAVSDSGSDGPDGYFGNSVMSLAAVLASGHASSADAVGSGQASSVEGQRVGERGAEEGEDSEGGDSFLSGPLLVRLDSSSESVGVASPFALVQGRQSLPMPAGMPPLPTLPLPVGAEPFRGGPEGLAERAADLASGGEVLATGSPRLKPAQSEVQANLGVFKDLWMVIVGSLSSSTILNLVFPFFTFIPTTGVLGKSLPQVLFFTRIFADIIGRLLPRNKALALKSPYALLVLAVLELSIAAAYFVYLKAPYWQHDGVYLAMVSFFWVAGGYINTNSYILAPNMVQPKLCGRASAIMALTYQVAHFLGLVLAVIIMAALFGSVAHSGGHI